MHQDKVNAKAVDLASRERVNFVMDKGVMERLRQVSAEMHRPMSRIVDAAVTAYLADRDPGLYILINTHSGPIPECHGDWIDLALAEDLVLKKGEFGLFSLGVSMQLPDGYYAEMAPRSSTCKKYGILQANSIGIIDHDYCGDEDIWKFPAVAIRDTEIPKGTRICQFRLVKCSSPVNFVQVESLDSPARGGFGSTGN